MSYVHMFLTWGGLLQAGLKMCGESQNVVRRPGPEYKAVTGILKARLDLGIFQSK